MIYLPGDLDRVRFALAEACDISTAGVIALANIPNVRARAALDEMLLRGEVSRSEGHHHDMDGDFCQCRAGQDAGLPRITHWHSAID